MPHHVGTTHVFLQFETSGDVVRMGVCGHCMHKGQSLALEHRSVGVHEIINGINQSCIFGGFVPNQVCLGPAGFVELFEAHVNPTSWLYLKSQSHIPMMHCC